MYNRSNLIRQKRSKQREYDRLKEQEQARSEQFNYDLWRIKREIDMIDQRLQKK